MSNTAPRHLLYLQFTFCPWISFVWGVSGDSLMLVSGSDVVTGLSLLNPADRRTCSDTWMSVSGDWAIRFIEKKEPGEARPQQISHSGVSEMLVTHGQTGNTKCSHVDVSSSHTCCGSRWKTTCGRERSSRVIVTGGEKSIIGEGPRCCWCQITAFTL